MEQWMEQQSSGTKELACKGGEITSLQSKLGRIYSDASDCHITSFLWDAHFHTLPLVLTRNFIVELFL